MTESPVCLVPFSLGELWSVLRVSLEALSRLGTRGRAFVIVEQSLPGPRVIRDLQVNGCEAAWLTWVH